MEGENSGRVEQINGIHISGESDVSFLVKLHNNQTDRWLPCEEIATAFNEKHLDDYLRRERLALSLWRACLGANKTNGSVVDVVPSLSKRTAKPNFFSWGSPSKKFKHSAVGSRPTSSDDGQQAGGSGNVVVRHTQPLEFLMTAEKLQTAASNRNEDNGNVDSSVVSGLEELDSTASEITESEEEEQANRLLSIDEMMEVIQPQVENATRSIASTFPSKEVVVKNHETQRLNVSSSDPYDATVNKTINAALSVNNEGPNRREELRQIVIASSSSAAENESDTEEVSNSKGSGNVNEEIEASSEMTAEKHINTRVLRVRRESQAADVPVRLAVLAKRRKSVSTRAKIPRKQQENDVFMVEKIIEHRKKGNRTEYFIKWENYSSEHNSWEPAKNCSPSIIQDYTKLQAQKNK